MDQVAHENTRTTSSEPSCLKEPACSHAGALGMRHRKLHSGASFALHSLINKQLRGNLGRTPSQTRRSENLTCKLTPRGLGGESSHSVLLLFELILECPIQQSFIAVTGPASGLRAKSLEGSQQVSLEYVIE